MTERKATKKEQLAVIQNAVETAIEQASQLSGLRNWYIWNCFKHLKEGEWPKDEMICQSIGRELIIVFGDIVDGDDKEFFESNFYTECDTEKGIFRLHDLIYESEPIE